MTITIKSKQIYSFILFTLVLLFALLMLYPLLWMMSTSVKANVHVYNTGLIPIELHLDNYINIWSQVSLLKGLVNSTLITAPVVFCSVMLASLAAFAFAKLDFKGKNILFFAVLGSSMIPFSVIMLPQFILFNSIKLLNGPWAYIIPRLTGGAFTIFFLRQYLYGVPDSVIEAAKIDGASFGKIFLQIVFPLITPAVVAQIILGFIGTWNDYLGPLLFIRSRAWQTLPLIISAFNSGASAANRETPMLMAASLISMLPILIVFAVFQKKIVNSVMLSGAKL